MYRDIENLEAPWIGCSRENYEYRHRHIATERDEDDYADYLEAEEPEEYRTGE